MSSDADTASASRQDAAARPAGRLPVVSVRARILATMVVIAALGLTVAGGVSYVIQRDRQLADVDDRLVASVEAARFVLSGESDASQGGALVARSSGDPITSTADAVEAVLARVLPAPFQSSLGLLDGQPAYVPSAPVPFALQDDEELLREVESASSDGKVHLGTTRTGSGSLRWIAAPVDVAGDFTRGLYLTAFDLDGELSALRSSFLTYAVVALLTLVAVAVAGHFVAGRLLAPIRRLRETASRITATDRGERIPVTGRDDVSELTVTVNGMLDRLDGAMSSQRRLLDDVRHELGTPITIVRGHLELLDPSDADDVRTVRALALDELDRMGGLVAGIAELSSSEAAPERFSTDLPTLTHDVFAKARVLSGHEWVLVEVAEGRALLDSARITQAWLQLADNAAKYADPGTQIRLGSSRDGDDLAFWVADSGPGIPADARSRIFERFGRAENGRGVAGSGLGLAIVRAIARGHGGDVSVVSSAAGSRFSLRIPDTGVPVQAQPRRGTR